MFTLSSWLLNQYRMESEHVQELSRHQYLESIAAPEMHARMFHSWRPAAIHTILLHPPDLDGNGFMLSLKLAASIISGPDGAHVGVGSDAGRTVIVSNPGNTFLDQHLAQVAFGKARYSALRTGPKHPEAQ